MLSDLVLRRVAELDGKPALLDGCTGRVVSYRELGEATARTAAGLAHLGLRKGDVVAICLPNRPEFCVAFHGALRAGAVVTTASPLATEDELAFQLEDSGARYLVVAPEGIEKARAAALRAGVDRLFVVRDDPSEAEIEGTTPFDGLAEYGAQRVPIDVDPGEVAVLPYSSGTTGLPKGVMLTHGNLMANLSALLPVHGITEHDRELAVLPFCHIYGMQAVMNLSLLGGATVVTLPRFHLAQFLTAVQDHRVTRVSVVPPIARALAREPAVDDYDLSSLEQVVSGAAPLGAELTIACAERLGCPVIQGYGLTEASPVTHLSPPEGPHVPGSVGRPLPGTECRVVDVETGADVPVGATGELWVRGAQVMRGYLNDPVATARVKDEEGWLHTGDLVSVDADGCYYVVDRVKELIKYKGHQVAPAELEAVLLSHPSVADAAVVPSPDEEAGEVPKAFVVLRAPATAGELIEFVADRVAPPKRVRRVQTVDEIPRSPAGKILRRALARQERDAPQDVTPS